jgi:hypothetical protein
MFLYLSLFAAFPAPTNGWSPSLRPSAHLGLLAAGVLLIGAAFGSVYLSIAVPNRSWSASVPKPKPQNTAGPDDSHLRYSDDPKQHPVVLKYWTLPETQKEVVVFLYEHSHKSRISLDAFYAALVEKHGKEFVKAEDELFYRLKALRAEGFLGLEAVAHKETDVVKVDTVGKALYAADITNT